MRIRKQLRSTPKLDLTVITQSALSGSALDALKEFYADRDARQKQFEELKAQVEGEFDETAQKPLSMEAFTEDWNSSQFWVSIIVGVHGTFEELKLMSEGEAYSIRKRRPQFLLANY